MKIAAVALLLAIPASVVATKAHIVDDMCAYNTYMCCWTENDGQGMEDNTDVCAPAPRDRRRRRLAMDDDKYEGMNYESYDDNSSDSGSSSSSSSGRSTTAYSGTEFGSGSSGMSGSESGYSTEVSEYEDFAGGNEGDVHCHGFVWADGAHDDSFKVPLLKYVKKFDHIEDRGYYGRVRGGPMCGCIENMPVVSRADCTTFSSQGLVSCENNDLRTHYEGEMQSPGGELTENLVGNCHNE